MTFDFARLPSDQLQQIKQLEEKYNIVLIAYDDKYMK